MTTTTLPDFMDSDFLSFRNTPFNKYTRQQKVNYLTFKEWCVYNNYCISCTLKMPFEPVVMDEDMVPNCPYCDYYYYEEFKFAQECAVLSLKGHRLVHAETLMEEINPADMYYD